MKKITKVVIVSSKSNFDFVLKEKLPEKVNLSISSDLLKASLKLHEGDTVIINFSERFLYSEELVKKVKDSGVNIIFLYDNLNERKRIRKSYGQYCSCVCERKDIALAVTCF